MNKLLRKLKSESGASIVIALVFFLICVMVGTAVVRAASTNLGRVNRIDSEQKAYFAVRSAAELLRDELNGMEFSAVQDKWDDKNNTHGTLDQTAHCTLAPIDPLSSFKGKIKSAAETMFGQCVAAKSAGGAAEQALDAFAVTAQNVQDVAVTNVRVDETFNLHFTLDTAADAEYHHPMTLVIPAVSAYNGEPREVTWTTTTTNPDGSSSTNHHRAPYTRYTLTVTWGVGTITKGGEEP